MEDRNDRDAPLRSLLREWEPQASLPPRFQEEVWRRIERAEISSPPSVSALALFQNWIANLLPKPALATAYLVLLVGIGATVGWSQARQETARITRDLSVSYVQAVDPYRATP